MHITYFGKDSNFLITESNIKGTQFTKDNILEKNCSLKEEVHGLSNCDQKYHEKKVACAQVEKLFPFGPVLTLTNLV